MAHSLRRLRLFFRVLGSWDITGFAAAAQTADAPDTVLPEGVAIRIPAGSVVLMNTHYLNATSEPIATDTRMNLYSIPDAAVKEEAGFLTFYDPFIRVPAMGSAQSARMSCPVPSDVNIVNVTSHMHRRGVHFEASVLGAGGKGKSKLFETDEWADVHHPAVAARQADRRRERHRVSLRLREPGERRGRARTDDKGRDVRAARRLLSARPSVRRVQRRWHQEPGP
jgi:hypothetical protein